MTRRRELERHRHILDETRDIMNSMKTLAYMETRKLVRFLDAQRSVVAHIEAVAGDFLGFYPETLPQSDKLMQVYLLLGSERGFCGEFNETLLKQTESHMHNNGINTPRLIATGSKLCDRLEKDPRVVAFIDGANVAEEVEKTLIQIIDHLVGVQTQDGTMTLSVFYHEPVKDEIVTTRVLPPFEQSRKTAPLFAHPPLLNLRPEAFLAELIDHYLFAALHQILYMSLMAENQHRVQHLEGAVRHLEDKSADLLHRCNVLRQEEIIEEIEVILLSDTSHNQPIRKKHEVGAGH
ncbi:MAG: FoF1 ATP synthase subunit gamma [Pseudomonadota bacterium]